MSTLKMTGQMKGDSGNTYPQLYNEKISVWKPIPNAHVIGSVGN